MATQLVKRIVVGVDGSSHAAAALDWAIGLARLTDAEVIAVYGVYVPVFASSGYEPALQFDPVWRKEMQRAFENEWCAALKASGVPFRTIFRDGRPATVIADAADSVGAELVVVGRRGRGKLAELMLGSVSHELSHHCKRPVVLISDAERVEADAPPTREVAAVG